MNIFFIKFHLSLFQFFGHLVRRLRGQHKVNYTQSPVPEESREASPQAGPSQESEQCSSGRCSLSCGESGGSSEDSERSSMELEDYSESSEAPPMERSCSAIGDMEQDDFRFCSLSPMVEDDLSLFAQGPEEEEQSLGSVTGLVEVKVGGPCSEKARLAVGVLPHCAVVVVPPLLPPLLCCLFFF